MIMIHQPNAKKPYARVHTPHPTMRGKPRDMAHITFLAKNLKLTPPGEGELIEMGMGCEGVGGELDARFKVISPSTLTRTRTRTRTQTHKCTSARIHTHTQTHTLYLHA